VACQNPCIDIDSERTYWQGLSKPEETWLRYGYVGLVVGYFVYYYLYAGNWDYYFSGAWVRQIDQLASLKSPGFYLFRQALNIPKLVAVPLTLGSFTVMGYRIGYWIEKCVQATLPIVSTNSAVTMSTSLTKDIVKHRIFTLCTFGIFNFFFIFSGRPLVQLLPEWIQHIYDFILVFLSTIWVYRTWQRCPAPETKVAFGLPTS
jgi:hypothetical protein